jgi:Major Facilitator Superfamily
MGVFIAVGSIRQSYPRGYFPRSRSWRTSWHQEGPKLIATGMWVQAAGIAAVALGSTFAAWAVAAAVIGAGTAMVYPTLLAAVGDVAHPAWRARSVGAYRLWRGSGFAVGALLVGVVADSASLTTAIWVVAAITAPSGVIVAIRMDETLGHHAAPLSTLDEPSTP